MNASPRSVVAWSVGALVALTVACVLVGFVWLPSVQADFRARDVWNMICRAAGVPQSWQAGANAPTVHSTKVVFDAAMSRPGGHDAVGRGATLALQCTMCHGPRGVSEANAPNLAGQYPDVIVKQLVDYRNGDRTSAIMQALAHDLSDAQVHDLAAYFSDLPKPRNGPITDMSAVPALVRVGDPLRNIAPCAACHGGIERKVGAPWLETMPKEYLVVELQRFARGERHNDALAQMRNMARALKPAEIEEVAGFYARRGE